MSVNLLMCHVLVDTLNLPYDLCFVHSNHEYCVRFGLFFVFGRDHTGSGKR